MKIRYCKHRDIIITYREYNLCNLCGERADCETLILRTNTFGSTPYEEAHRILVREYLRREKLKRILE